MTAHIIAHNFKYVCQKQASLMILMNNNADEAFPIWNIDVAYIFWRW